MHGLDGELNGEIRYGKGNDRFNFVHRWTGKDATVSWPVRLKKAQKFEVGIRYQADKKSEGNTFVIELGEQSIAGKVELRKRDLLEETIWLGTYTLGPDLDRIIVRPGEMPGSELMQLQGLVLKPVE